VRQYTVGYPIESTVWLLVHITHRFTEHSLRCGAPHYVHSGNALVTGCIAGVLCRFRHIETYVYYYRQPDHRCAPPLPPHRGRYNHTTQLGGHVVSYYRMYLNLWMNDQLARQLSAVFT